MQQLIAEAQKIQNQLVEWRRQIHKNPELGMDLPLTTAFIKERLAEMGYAPKDCGPSGVTATVGGKKPGKAILLRADTDALPVREEAQVPFASENGSMHACGHDMHTTMLLGAAKLLKDHEDELQGTVKLMFQPGEEVLLGAKTMLENGLLEDPKPDAAAMIHVAVGYPVPAGLVIVPEGGAFTAASDSFVITVKGKGGHGAMPESAVDPLVISAHILLALQTIRSREVSGGENCVVTIGALQGGMANNVIPDTAQMKGTIRTFSKEARALIPKRIQEIATGVAASMRATAEVEIIEGTPSVLVDGAFADQVRQILRDTFGEQAVPDIQQMGMSKMNGSEDFAFVSEHVPTVMLALTAGGSEPQYAYPVHHPKACFNEAVLAHGAAVYASVAMNWLGMA